MRINREKGKEKALSPSIREFSREKNMLKKNTSPETEGGEEDRMECQHFPGRFL